MVRIHRQTVVRIRSHLPARQVDRRDARLHLLHRLVAGECAERVDERHLVRHLPKLLCTAFGQRIFDLHRTAQAVHVFRRVTALDAFPARILGPVFLDSGNFLLSITHDFL
jgi:hypothetical protein